MTVYFTDPVLFYALDVQHESCLTAAKSFILKTLNAQESQWDVQEPLQRRTLRTIDHVNVNLCSLAVRVQDIYIVLFWIQNQFVGTESESIFFDEQKASIFENYQCYNMSTLSELELRLKPYER